MTRKNNSFESCSWFKFNSLGLALGMALKFWTSVAKVSKLKGTKLWRLIPMFVEASRKKTSPPKKKPLRKPFHSFVKQRSLFVILHCNRNVTSFINNLVISARWIATTGVPSLRNLAEIWSIPQALASSLKLVQLMLFLHCVKQNHHTYFKSAYNTLQRFRFQIHF